VLLGVGVYFVRGQKAKTGSVPSAPAGGRPRGFGAVPVVAARATKGTIGVYLIGLGTVTPIYTVSVKSRVDGQLMKVLYKEGDVVHQGDLLVEIDPRPFEVQLTQAEGQLLKDQAALDNARIDLARYQTLLTQNAVAEQQLATQKALVAQYEGAVKTDQGQIDSAKLNLVYSHIIAPITGRVGLRLVDPGNIVHASDTNGLLVITQIQPISLIFTIAEDQLPTVMDRMRTGQRLRVDAYDRDKMTKLGQGYLATIDNQIDPTTGTLRLRAIFDNNDKALFPNEFVNARLLAEEKKGVTLLPSAAVQRNSQMTYVWMVKPDSTVSVRQITVGTTEGGESEITSGLSPGNTVVMTGVDKLQENSKVIAHFEGDTAPRGTTK
jgi:multidrug efflux system membrane fusion protein